MVWAPGGGYYRGRVSSEPTQDVPAGPAAGNFWGRRLAAIIVDWFASMAVSVGFFAGHPMATLGIFALTTIVLQGTLGSTIGHRLVGVGTRTAQGTVPGLSRALVRTGALCLVLPPVITDAEGRGLHERWSGTYVVALR